MERDLPEPLLRDRHADLVGRAGAPWVRRVIVVVLTAIVVVAALGVLGQRPRTSEARGQTATLELDAPNTTRGGLLYQARVEVSARTPIDRPTLVLGEGWTEQVQVNTLEPAPVEEDSRDGKLELTFARVGASERLTVWMQFQTNPSVTGTRDGSVELLDGQTKLTSISRRLKVLP